MSQLDSILNIAIPVLLIVVVCGFVWVKMLEPWFGNHLKRLWEWIKGSSQAQTTTIKEIVYD